MKEKLKINIYKSLPVILEKVKAVSLAKYTGKTVS